MCHGCGGPERRRLVLVRHVDPAMTLRQGAHPSFPDAIDVAMIEIENWIVGRA